MVVPASSSSRVAVVGNVDSKSTLVERVGGVRRCLPRAAVASSRRERRRRADGDRGPPRRRAEGYRAGVDPEREASSTTAAD